MAGVEWLRNIRRRELYDHALPSLGWVRGVPEARVSIGAVGGLILQDRGDDGLGQRLGLEKELDMGTEGLWRFD